MRSAFLVGLSAIASGSIACSLLVGEGFSEEPERDGGASDAVAESSPPGGDAGVGGDATGSDAGAVTVRGIDRATVDTSAWIRLHPPEGTRAGDVLWAVTSTYYDVAVKPAPGFVTVTSTYEPSCTSAGWRIGVYARIATAAEPAEYAFEYKESGFDWASGILVALAGTTTATSSSLVATNAVLDHAGNPYTTPSLTAGAAPSFGIATYVREHGNAATFSVPPGFTRLGEHGGIAVLGQQLPAGGVLTAGSSTVTPDGCGFAHAALLDLR
jgi:hypothetical protein